ncbi:type IV secretion system protein VirD4 [Tranquillimonas rosea]|uniref:Type IV secretion system protein VirD4 n=1 Tax=Tranquillimonas rosea TaxID=641238 RepID=A0A1H9VI79_9RHOB|nr:type IV secretory system conjugative DNA transfer family protein [Tranquillimonas rosea]SES21352.1 type IV secretion system protein VirD4 [Tranquillimonas rosea]
MTTKDFLQDDLPRGVKGLAKRYQAAPHAQWADTASVVASQTLGYDPDNPGDKILVGAVGDRLIGIADDRHLMTVAGSRGGKSVAIIGNLLCYRGPVMCTDPKAELASITAAQRARLGQKVCILDPFERCAPDVAKYRTSYNPLSVLDPDSDTIIEDAGLIADALVIASPDQKEPHWDESARNFIEGLILHIVTASEFAGARNLITVRTLIRDALIAEPRAALDPDLEGFCKIEYAMLSNAERLKEHDEFNPVALAIEGAARDFYDKGDSERSSVLSTVRRHTKFLDYKAMHRVLSGHDFSLDELKTHEHGLSIYLCLPAGRLTSCARWLRMFIYQMLDSVERTPSRPAAPPALMILDEFASLGRMRALEDAIAQVAGFGLKLWVIVQDWGQGKALYKERWESFTANAGIFQAFGVNDVATSEYIARRLGKAPVEVATQSDVATKQLSEGVSGRQASVQMFDLLSPDEITRYFARSDAHKRQLVIWSGYHPMILQRVEYYDPQSPAVWAFAGKFSPRK